MSKARNQDVTASPAVDELFLNLAEQVKLPFVQIAYAAELMDGQQDAQQLEQSRQTIALSSQAALRLIDGYLLSVAMQREGTLQLEPVSISSVMYDSAQILSNYARAHNCDLQLQVGGKYEPVMAHRLAVQSALVSLGLSFIEAATNHAADTRAVVRLAVRRNGAGLNTGVFSNNPSLTSAVFARAKSMQGKVHQPLAEFGSGNGSGIFIADALFTQLQTSMKVARSGGFPGLAATLLPSRQLSLV